MSVTIPAKNKRNMFSMIEAQDRCVQRIVNAHARTGPRASGLAYSRSVAAAKKDLRAALLRNGFRATDADIVVRDTHDMAKLEIDACVGI